MRNDKFFAVKSASMTVSTTAASMAIPYDEASLLLPSQVVVSATGAGAYVRHGPTNDNLAVVGDLLVQPGDSVKLNVRNSRWLSARSVSGSSLVGISALSTGIGDAASSLALNFTSGTLDPRITFTRGTNATYTNSAGNVQLTAGINNARFDYDPVTLACKGLLIEEARTNLLTYSEQFDNAIWSKGNITTIPEIIIAPSGQLAGDALIESTLASSYHYVDCTQTKSAAIKTYTYSVYVKDKGRHVAITFSDNGSNGVSGRVDPSTGTSLGAGAYGIGWASSSLTITSVSNGWYRVIMVFTTDASTVLGVQVSLYNSSLSTNVYTGDGVSGAYVWGAQLEAGAFPTSYIPTTTAAATRNADVASMTGTNFSSWYNQTQGTFVVNCLVAPTNAVLIGANIAANGASTINITYIDSSTGSVRLVVFSASSPTVVLYPVPVPSIGSVMKISTAYAANNFAASINGNSVSATASGALPIGTMDILGIGNVGTLSQWNTTIASISYYPTRLPNATIQALTV